MTSLNILENKISDIRKYLGILDGHAKVSAEELQTNSTVAGAVERYLYLATQATIDLAEAVISYKGLRKPRFYKEAFEILNENNLIDRDLSQKLQDMAGFRNILAHDYAEIDYEKVARILQGGFQDIHNFIRIAAAIT